MWGRGYALAEHLAGRADAAAGAGGEHRHFAPQLWSPPYREARPGVRRGRVAAARELGNYDVMGGPGTRGSGDCRERVLQ
jgi:hypothetical protein